MLQEEVKLLIEAELAIDRGRQTLVGHSLGGLFVLRSLFGGAGFQRHVAISPSIWFDDRRVLEEAEAFLTAPLDGAPAELLITVGELETSAGPGQPAAADPADSQAGLAAGLARRLAAPPQRLSADFALLAGKTHLSVVPPSLARALRLGCPSE